MQTLEQALDVLKSFPSAAVQQAAQTVIETIERRKRILNLIQEALSQLRLDIKYMAFDLECTRRERDEARGTA